MNPAHLCALALIAWSATLIVAGALWVLASQVGKLCELLAGRAGSPPHAAPRARAVGADERRKSTADRAA